jgi:SPP1 family predicted phage head-tail adaptor
MRAGLLRHRLQLQRVDGTPDSFGQPGTEWGTYATVWGSIEPLVGRERFTAQQVQAEVTHKVVMRANGAPDVRAKDRVVFEGRVFNILGPALNLAERGISLTLMVAEEQS